MQNSTEQLVTYLKAFADPIRLRLLALCVHGECTVSELTQVMGHSQPRISQHLKQLCDAGLLEKFRDGQFVYYRVPLASEEAAQRRRLFALLPSDEPVYESARYLHRALIELTVTMSLGDLIDIGSGQGRILKLLGSRAQRAVGVDISADARQLARAELLLAGIENCSLRNGDMYDLPFAAGEFDTVILDDVLGKAERPVAVMTEAGRILRRGGRLLLLCRAGGDELGSIEKQLAAWCGSADLRLAPPRRIPVNEPRWLLAVASPAHQEMIAA